MAYKYFWWRSLHPPLGKPITSKFPDTPAVYHSHKASPTGIADTDTFNMTMKRQSLKLDDIDWQVLLGIAADCGCEYRGTPSWRRLFDDIASGKLPWSIDRTSACATFKQSCDSP